MHADVAADETKWAGQQEGDAPAPRLQGRIAQCLVQQGHEQRAGEKSRRSTGRDQACVQPAPPCRGVFGEERRRSGVLTRRGEALDHPQQEQPDRGQYAGHSPGRQQSDAEGRARHDQNGPGQRPPPALTVTQGSPDDAAHRAQDERDREDGKSRQKGGGRVLVREEHRCDDRGEVGVRGVVEPLDEVADEARGGGPAQGRPFAALSHSRELLTASSLACACRHTSPPDGRGRRRDGTAAAGQGSHAEATGSGSSTRAVGSLRRDLTMNAMGPIPPITIIAPPSMASGVIVSPNTRNPMTRATTVSQ